jgi:predicted nuclease of predicted toxin-antitoxin system
MRAKTDENLSPDAAAWLRARGHDTLSVWEQDMRGGADDRLAEVCAMEGRALITLDLGFAQLHRYPPERYAGLIVLRLADQSRAAVIRALERIEPALRVEPIVGRLWVVDERSIRIRPAQPPTDTPPPAA